MSPVPEYSYLNEPLALFLIPDLLSIIPGKSSNLIESSFLPGKGCNNPWTSFKISDSSRFKDLSNLGTTSFIALCNFATSVAASALAACVASIPKRWASKPARVPA